MSDDRVRTAVETDQGPLAFQEYLVRRRAQDPVRDVRFEGIDRATPAPGVVEALASAEAIVIAPSNPIASIGPILALPGLRDAVRARRERVVAVSPIVAGRSLQPPAAEMVAGLGHEVSALAVARQYADMAAAFVFDEQDATLAPAIGALGMTPVVTDTVMRDAEAKRALAEAVLRAIR
jgi:LPPG:FO 2-phospho-L-lactate transferase